MLSDVKTVSAKPFKEKGLIELIPNDRDYGRVVCVRDQAKVGF